MSLDDSRWSETVPVVVSTTAWGRGVPADVALARIARHTEATVVELGPGTFPVQDPAEVLGAYADRFTYLAHHAAPVLPGGLLRPTASALATACRVLPELGVSRYSAHPPPRRVCPSGGAMWEWAFGWHDALANVGVEFRVETMYRPRTRDEHQLTGGYHLDDAVSVLRFCEAAQARGWDQPLLVDASHVHIGYHGGQWSSRDVHELLASGLSDHLHVSANDGRRDAHTVVPQGHLVEAWVLPHLERFTHVVDEAAPRGLVRASVRGAAAAV